MSAATMTPEDAANVCKLLERLRTGEMNLIPAPATATPRDPNGKSEALLQRVEQHLSEWLRQQDEPIGDGGPAFPRDRQLDANGDVVAWEEHGMSLRDYFIAHAPAEPQPWFKPVMPAVPAHPSDLQNLTEDEKATVVDFRAELLEVEDITSPRVRQWAEQVRAHNVARYEHEQNVERERYVQWPAAWADAMLRARSAS